VCHDGISPPLKGDTPTCRMKTSRVDKPIKPEERQYSPATAEFTKLMVRRLCATTCFILWLSRAVTDADADGGQMGESSSIICGINRIPSQPASAPYGRPRVIDELTEPTRDLCILNCSIKVRNQNQRWGAKVLTTPAYDGNSTTAVREN
jgi:hypothetical protein